MMDSERRGRDFHADLFKEFFDKLMFSSNVNRNTVFIKSLLKRGCCEIYLEHVRRQQMEICVS
jgi:hypothetical protein